MTQEIAYRGSTCLAPVPPVTPAPLPAWALGPVPESHPVQTPAAEPVAPAAAPPAAVGEPVAVPDDCPSWEQAEPPGLAVLQCVAAWNTGRTYGAGGTASNAKPTSCAAPFACCTRPREIRSHKR